MKRFGAFLIFLCLLQSSAFALTPGQKAALEAGFPPDLQANFLNNSILPSWITFSRGSNAMDYDSTGYVTYAPSNIILNSNAYVGQTVTVVPVANYLFSAYGAVGETIIFPAGCGGGTWTGTGVNNRVTLAFSTTATSCVLPNSSAGTVTNAQLEAVTYQTNPRDYVATAGSAYFGPRFGNDPDTKAAKGFLIEETRTNLMPYSRDYTFWVQDGATLVSLNNLSPDGTLNAQLWGGGTGNTRLIDSGAVTGNNTYTYSMYVKKGTANTFHVNMTTGGGGTPNPGNLYFDFNTAIATSDTNCTNPQAQSVGNAWYRISCQVTTLTSNTFWAAFLYPGGSYGQTAQTYMFGSQLELGDFYTSYIPTHGGTAQRLADNAQLAGAALTIAGAATGSAIVQTTQWENSTAAARDLLATATTRRLLYSNSSNTVLSSTNGTTRLDATIGGASTFTGNAVRSAVGWSFGGRSLVANSGITNSDTISLGTGGTVMLGGYGSTTTFDGWIASMALYRQKLPNNTLKQKSTVGASY